MLPGELGEPLGANFDVHNKSHRIFVATFDLSLWMETPQKQAEIKEFI